MGIWVSNESFGNNILVYLPESFHMSSYLTLQYLSEHLINISQDFTINNTLDVFTLTGTSIKTINQK